MLKLGDNVKIKDNISYINGNGNVPDMESFKGRVTVVRNTIITNGDLKVILEVDNGKWFWNPEDLDKLNDYSIGDKVRIVENRTDTMNIGGLMDEYLGKVLTVKHVIYTAYVMEECPRWVFSDKDIEEGVIIE